MNCLFHRPLSVQVITTKFPTDHALPQALLAFEQRKAQLITAVDADSKATAASAEESGSDEEAGGGGGGGADYSPCASDDEQHADSQQPAVRAEVVEALVGHGTPVIDLLIEQLDAEDLETRQAAVVALGDR